MDFASSEARDEAAHEAEAATTDASTRALLEAQLFLARLQARRPVVSIALLASIVLVFALEQLWGSGSTATLVRMGAEVPSRIHGGEWWRLLAPTFLHSGLPHVLMNGFGLWMLGSFVERLLGSARFLVLYTLSGLAGSVCGTLFSGLSKFSLSVGASGALFGLLGAAAVLGLRPRGRIPLLIARDLRKNALINLGLMVLISLSPHVDYLAHLGGVAAGMALAGIGLVAPTISLSLRSAAPARSGVTTWLWRGVAVISALLLYGSLAVAMKRGEPWQLVRPLKFERQRLGETGLSMEVPTLLGKPEVMKRDDGATEVAFGDGLEAPITMAVVVRPFEAPLPDGDSKALREHFDAAVASLRDSSPGKDAARMADPEEVTVDGMPALMMQFRYGPRGAILQRLFQVRPRYLVTLEMFSLGDTPNNLKLDLTQLLGSLRRDSQP